MRKKLLDLLAKKKAVVDRMKAADEANDQSAFDTAQAELAPLDAEIARTQAIIDAEEALPTGDDTESSPADGATTGRPVNSNAYIHAFAQCIRAQARGNRQMYAENAAILRRAVTNEGGLNEGTPAEGGVLVPQDIQTSIRELSRALNPLSDLFSIEEVTTLSGSRVMDTQPTTGFTKVTEFETIPRDAKPAFTRIDFKLEDYALIVPLSNDLLQDTDQNLIAYLSRWFAKKGVLTENTLLLNLLSALDESAVTPETGKELAAIKTAMNVNLDPAISLTSSFVTNQAGFNYLDLLDDADGRPLLQPNPTDATRKMLLGRPVSVMSNAMLPTTEASKAPLYIGDFSQYGTLFRRRTLEVASTNIGGNSWVTNSTEVRGIMRLDAQTFDKEAVTTVLLPIS